MTKWEYKIEEFLFESSLNSLGKDGWELVAAAVTMSSSKYIFKRPLPPSRQEG